MPGRGDLSHSRHWSSPGTFWSGDWCLSRCEVISNPDFFDFIVLFLIYFASYRKFQGSFNSGDRWRMKVLVQLNEFDQNETCWATPEPGLIAASIAVSPHLNPEISHGTRLISNINIVTHRLKPTDKLWCLQASSKDNLQMPAGLSDKQDYLSRNKQLSSAVSPVLSFHKISLSWFLFEDLPALLHWPLTRRDFEVILLYK